MEGYFGGPEPAWRLVVARLAADTASAQVARDEQPAGPAQPAGQIPPAGPGQGEFDRVVLDMLAPWEHVAGLAGWRMPGGLACCYVATTTQLSRVVEALRGHGGFTEPAAWESMQRGWHGRPCGQARAPDGLAYTGFLVTARRLAAGVTAPPRRRRPAKGAHPDPDDGGGE